MFGGRLIPSALIGTGLAAWSYIVGGVAQFIGFLPAGSDVALALMSFVIPVAIGLYKDAKEAME